MNRNPVVWSAPSIDFPLFTSTMAIHFWVLARFLPSRCVMRSPSYSPIFWRGLKSTLVNSPRPSMRLGLTAMGTGHVFLWAGGAGIRAIVKGVTRSESVVDVEAFGEMKWMNMSPNRGERL